jgi:hypothetical protein
LLIRPACFWLLVDQKVSRAPTWMMRELEALVITPKVEDDSVY